MSLSPLTVLIGILILLIPLWKEGYPWGSDSWGHLQRAAYMGHTIREYGIWDGLFKSAWMPDWYMGDPTQVYYPPLTMWILGLLTALVGNAVAAYRLLITGLLIMLGLSVHHISIRWGARHWQAVFGALLVVGSPYTLRTIFVEGNLPRGLALLPLPWIVWYTEQILSEKKIARPFIFLSGLWMLTLVAHPMQAAAFAIGIGVYIVARILTNVYIPLRRCLVALLPVGLGLILAAAYLLPAYSHAELANVPSLPQAKIDLFSISLGALFPNQTNIEAISLGIAAALCAVIITFRTGSEYHKALLAAALTCVILAFGPSGGLYRMIPMHESLLPERFLNLSAVFFAMIFATIPPGMWKRRWLLAAFVLVFVIDVVPALRAVHMRPAPPAEVAIARELAKQPPSGRVANLAYPNPNASQIYLNSEVGHHPNVLGWALENTPHQDAIRRLQTAAIRSPDYLERVLSLWNTDYLVTRYNGAPDDPASPADLGFQQIIQLENLNLWRKQTPSSVVQLLPDNRMLIIGNNATDWLFAFPFASEGSYADPALYDAEYLSHFTTIGLTRLPEDVAIEGALGDWVRSGNTLIVDLSGMSEIYGNSYTLDNVHAFPLMLEGEYRAAWPQELGNLPQLMSFSTPEGPWIGATYAGLEEQVAVLRDGDQTYPLLGYQTVGKGRIWFIGFNLIYYFEQTDQHEQAKALVDYMLADTATNRDLILPELAVEEWQYNSTTISFQYTSPVAVDVVLSVTYFPRWQASIDRREIAIHNHEHLMQLKLPAGTHTVALEYQPFGTKVAKTGWLVSALGIGITGAIVYHFKRHPPLVASERAQSFSDRLPQMQPKTTSGYAQCPNCQFRLAKSGPPNDRSYPFDTLECPICGFSIGGTTELIFGDKVNELTKWALAALWLQHAQITEGRLKDEFGFTLLEIFDPYPPDDDNKQTRIK